MKLSHKLTFPLNFHRCYDFAHTNTIKSSFAFYFAMDADLSQNYIAELIVPELIDIFYLF